jgi:hypothetical protein
MPHRTLPVVPTHRDRDPRDLDTTPVPSPVRHDPLKGRRGAVLGVEPVQRTTAHDADDDLARRARRLNANAWRSVGPPGT